MRYAAAFSLPLSMLRFSPPDAFSLFICYDAAAMSPMHTRVAPLVDFAPVSRRSCQHNAYYAATMMSFRYAAYAAVEYGQYREQAEP